MTDQPPVKDTKVANKKTHKKRVCLPRGMTLSDRDLQLLKLVRNATIISRHQIHQISGRVQQIGIKEDPKNLNRRLGRLVRNSLIVAGKAIVPFATNTFSISHMGLLALELYGEHLGSVSSNSDVLVVPNQTVHFLTLCQIMVKWYDAQNFPQPDNYRLDREIKATGCHERRYAKDYDSLLDLPAYCGTLGIEFEQHLKTREAYLRISSALDKEQQVGAVLYLTNSPEYASELLNRIRTISFPVAAVAVSDFLRCTGSVYQVQVLCQASPDGPIWECDLLSFLNYSEEIHHLHLDENEWNRWFTNHRRIEK